MRAVLPVIVISQFFCTSLWFAGNAIVVDLAAQFHLGPDYLAHLASAVQFGFISGTLVFAILSIADRYSPSNVFFVCAWIAAGCNLMILLPGMNSASLILARFLTGFFLAGIYPVGMKIAADHYQEGLGKSLGYLVGALVLGTAFPHVLKSVTAALPWRYVIISTSLLAAAGGITMKMLVADGVHRQAAQQVNFSGFLKGFQDSKFRATAFGYFGHMWELYAFWVFVPVMLLTWQNNHAAVTLNIPLLSFLIIASGSLSCVAGGILSTHFGPRKVAAIALSISCACCIISPLILNSNSLVALILFLFVWGVSVIADSPLFSTLIARHASPETKGSSLTIVNCIGFAITIVSIELINSVRTTENATAIYMTLALGPVIGLFFFLRTPGEKNA